MLASRTTEQVETGSDAVSGAILARRRRRLAALVLRTELPLELILPAGRTVVDYAAPTPVASARAQAFFGLRLRRAAGCR